MDKQPHLCNVHFTKYFIVDTAEIGGREKLLPGEVFYCRVRWKKSAEAIVIGSNEPRIDTVEASQASEGLNIKQLSCRMDLPMAEATGKCNRNE